MRYLQGTKNYMLTSKRFDDLAISSYLNFNFDDCSDNHKSMFGYIFIMVRGAMPWKSIKQSLTAT